MKGGGTCWDYANGQKWANELKIYDSEKNLVPRGWYDHNSQRSLWYISKISGEHLLDHWSSGFVFGVRMESN